jgi:two-component system response regulator HydG
MLVVDDRPNMLLLLTKLFKTHATVATARGVSEACRIIDEGEPALVLCDLRMDDGSGLDVLRHLRARRPATPFVLMTAHSTVDIAVQAMREGADDYVTKPFDTEQLIATVTRLLGRVEIMHAAGETSARPESLLVGRSPKLRDVERLIDLFAPTDATVLITGETGTGKELVARALHERSPRGGRAMVSVNCAALPAELVESELFGHRRGAFTGAMADRTGLFEAAAKTTLFLDEIGDILHSAQAKLTRVLESKVVRRIGDTRERTIDVRLIAATHRDLRAMAREHQFREDLFFRLNVCTIEVPPLRERREDIPLLAAHFLAGVGSRRRNAAIAFHPDAMARLVAYDWPGNIRELRSVVERSAIVTESREIHPGALPPEVAAGERRPHVVPAGEGELRGALEAARDEAHRVYLEAVLRRYRGNVHEASTHAGVERESFYRLCRRYGIVPDAFRKDD